MSATEDATRAAALGAAHFDLFLGAGWARSEDLDPAKLNEESGRWGILGQVFYDPRTMAADPEAAFEAGAKALGLDDADIDRLGFDAPTYLGVTDECAYCRALEAAWSAEIATRRAA